MVDRTPVKRRFKFRITHLMLCVGLVAMVLGGCADDRLIDRGSWLYFVPTNHGTILQIGARWARWRWSDTRLVISVNVGEGELPRVDIPTLGNVRWMLSPTTIFHIHSASGSAKYVTSVCTEDDIERLSRMASNGASPEDFELFCTKRIRKGDQ